MTRCICGLRLALHFDRDNRPLTCAQTAEQYPTAGVIDRWLHDASGRAVAPPQAVIAERPAGPWSNNGRGK